MLEAVKLRKGNEGFNALTGVYEDLFIAGIVDPTMVSRSALENAASISSLFLTTEAAVVDIPSKDSDMPMGGMGGMGGMM